MADLLKIPDRPPANKRGRPPASGAELERRRLAAWLADAGVLRPCQVASLCGVTPRLIRYWRAAEREAS